MLVAGVGVAGAGRGYLNGDAACYAAQAMSGELGERTVHLGWTSLGWVLGLVAGGHLPLALDLAVALAAGVAVWAMGARSGTWAAAALAALVLPWASFAEVDVPWVAALVGAVAVGDRRVAAGLMALGVSLSPVALLALPWVAWERRLRGPWRAEVAWLVVGAVVAVGVLTVAGGGDWWTGDRGVLASASPRPWRALQAWAWALGPLALLGVLRWRRALPALALCMPLLLAPPDAPAWLVPGAALALVIGELGDVRGGWLAAALALLGGMGLWGWRGRVEDVAREDAAIREVIAAMGPEDGLVAPWTWGARASVIATGDPYALRWRVPGETVRDQAERWCEVGLVRVAVVGEGAVRWVSGEEAQAACAPRGGTGGVEVQGGGRRTDPR